MKTSKLFTIDTEIAEKLKVINGSKLVNGLLKEYFELRSDKNTLLEEKTAVLTSISKKKSLFLKRLRLLRNGIRLVLITIPKHGLRRGVKILQELPYALTLKDGGFLHLRNVSKEALV